MSRKLIRNAVYQVKHALGREVSLVYALATPGYNPTDGTLTRLESRINVRKAVVMDQDQYRKFAYDLAYIAAAKEFTSGGYYSNEFRAILLDDVDLNQRPYPGWAVEFDGRRLIVDKVRGYEGYTILICIGTDASIRGGV